MKLINGLLIGLTAITFVGLANAEQNQVLMKTSKGDITLSLDSAKAPKTVENFLAYVDQGFYDGTIFTVSSRIL